MTTHAAGSGSGPVRRRDVGGVRTTRQLYAAEMADHAFDPLETPHCPIHPTERLVIAGNDLDGRDAHWRCPVPGCIYSQLT